LTEGVARLLGRSLKGLFVLTAMLAASPVVLCAPQKAARDCCQGEQRTPCEMPDPRPHSAPAPSQCCLVSPDSPAAAAGLISAKLEPSHAFAGDVPLDAGVAIESRGPPVDPTVVGGMRAGGGALPYARELYLLTRRLRL